MEGLKAFGLTDNEIRIYLSLLQAGPSGALGVAKVTGFSRPYVYDALERLREKGMVSLLQKDNRNEYAATDPRHLEELLLQRLELVRRLIPSLQEIQRRETDDTRVELHKGMYVYKILLNDIISTVGNGGQVLIFGIDDGFLLRTNPHYLNHLRQYYARLAKKRIREKAIVRSQATVFHEVASTVYRFLPQDVIGNTAFEVYGDKVAIFLWGTPHYLILIRNKEVARSYRNQFRLLWQVARPSR